MMQLKTEVVLLVAVGSCDALVAEGEGDSPSPKLGANQMVRGLFPATRASRSRSTTGRRRYALPQRHRSG